MCPLGANRPSDPVATGSWWTAFFIKVWSARAWSTPVPKTCNTFVKYEQPTNWLVQRIPSTLWNTNSSPPPKGVVTAGPVACFWSKNTAFLFFLMFFGPSVRGVVTFGDFLCFLVFLCLDRTPTQLGWSMRWCNCNSFLQEWIQTKMTKTNQNKQKKHFFVEKNKLPVRLSPPL